MKQHEDTWGDVFKKYRPFGTEFAIELADFLAPRMHIMAEMFTALVKDGATPMRAGKLTTRLYLGTMPRELRTRYKEASRALLQ